LGLLYRGHEETDEKLQMWLHVDTDSARKGSEYCSKEDRVYLVCMSISIEDERHLHELISLTVTHNHALPTVASLLTTDQPVDVS